MVLKRNDTELEEGNCVLLHSCFQTVDFLITASEEAISQLKTEGKWKLISCLLMSFTVNLYGGWQIKVEEDFGDGFFSQGSDTFLGGKIDWSEKGK